MIITKINEDKNQMLNSLKYGYENLRTKFIEKQNNRINEPVRFNPL